MTAELLLEIGTEEIPAGFIAPALEGMKGTMELELKAHHIQCGTIVTLGTPRRLVICVKEMSTRQDDTLVEAMGPPEKVAFTADGKPTKAAESFAQRQGVSVADLTAVDTPKGRYL
ncbi:MAG TPA: glycine--tRNA ligase subunit beta, partial [Thermodesulfobacteriota bacterium]|nr:glycine--tRNA ligase subunit beta [Thermodesulfobacteriota bacterium]